MMEASPQREEAASSPPTSAADSGAEPTSSEPSPGQARWGGPCRGREGQRLSDVQYCSSSLLYKLLPPQTGAGSFTIIKA